MRVHHTGSFVADTRWKNRLFVIDAFPQHDLGPIEADRFDPDADLTRARIALRYLLQAQHFRPAGLMKTHNSRHIRAPDNCLEFSFDLS